MNQNLMVFIEPKFNGVYSSNNLPKAGAGAYVINLDEFRSIGTPWIALHVNGNNIIYFNNFGVKYIPKEIKIFIADKNIIRNTYRLQAYDSIMCGYFCIGFIDFMLKVKIIQISNTNLYTNYKLVYEFDYTNQSIQTCYLLMIMRRMIK